MPRSGGAGRGGDAESPADDGPRQVERGGVVAQDEARVGGEDDAVQLEGERVGILVRGELVLLDGGDGELADQRREPGLERRDLLLDRPRAGTDLQGGPGEEAAARERAPQEVVAEGVAHGHELRDPRRGGEGRCDHLGVEDPPRFVHGGELEVLLGAEVGVHAALAHADGAGEVTDREAFEAVEGRERHRLAHDRFAGALSVGALLPLAGHVDKIARPVVLCTK